MAKAKAKAKDLRNDSTNWAVSANNLLMCLEDLGDKSPHQYVISSGITFDEGLALLKFTGKPVMKALKGQFLFVKLADS